jgi:hypothetical protein
MNSVSMPSRPAARASCADAATSALVANLLVSLEPLTDASGFRRYRTRRLPASIITYLGGRI